VDDIEPLREAIMLDSPSNVWEQDPEQLLDTLAEVLQRLRGMDEGTKARARDVIKLYPLESAYPSGGGDKAEVWGRIWAKQVAAYLALREVLINHEPPMPTMTRMFDFIIRVEEFRRGREPTRLSM